MLFNLDCHLNYFEACKIGIPSHNREMDHFFRNYYTERNSYYGLNVRNSIKRRVLIS